MIDFGKLKEEQSRLAKKVVTKDNFEKLELIAGVDQAYANEEVISAIVVCKYPSMEVVEKTYAISQAKLPYVPGFLSYREGPAIGEAYANLKQKPDVLIFDGNGILHPLKCGIASHMGVLLDICTIGVAKNLLAGDVKKNKVYINKELRAEVIITREHAKPLYVSPGHKISLKTSMEIVRNSIKFPHKLPEPVHLAHKHANEMRNKLTSGQATLSE